MQNRASSVEKGRLITRRVFMLAAAKLILLGGITSRLYSLQISDREKYEYYARKQNSKYYSASKEYLKKCHDASKKLKLPDKTVKELDLMTKDAHLQSIRRDQRVGKIAIAYTVWSKKKGGGKLIVKEVFKKIKKSNHLNRLVTLSPLTDMARNFHLRNGAVELQVNQDTQNFEYKI